MNGTKTGEMGFRLKYLRCLYFIIDKRFSDTLEKKNEDWVKVAFQREIRKSLSIE